MPAYWILTPLLSLCLCYGEDKLEHMTLLDPIGVCSQPLGYFGGLIEGGCSSPLWSRVFEAVGECDGRGSTQKITGGNWTPSACTGMSGQGETERTGEQ